MDEGSRSDTNEVGGVEEGAGWDGLEPDQTRAPVGEWSIPSTQTVFPAGDWDQIAGDLESVMEEEAGDMNLFIEEVYSMGDMARLEVPGGPERIVLSSEDEQ